MLDPSKKKRYPSPRAKEKPQQDRRKSKIAFRIKPYTCQRCSEGSNKTLCAPGDSTETEPDLPLSVWVSPAEVQVSNGLPQGQELRVQQTCTRHKPSWRRSPLTPSTEPPEVHRTGETDSWGNKTLCALGPRERHRDSTRDWPRLARECPGVSSRGVGWQRPAAGFGALGVVVCAWDLLKEVTIIFITSTTVWPQVKQQGGNIALPFNRKLD